MFFRFVWYFIHFTCVLCSLIPSHSIIYWLRYILAYCFMNSFCPLIRMVFSSTFSGFQLVFLLAKCWQFFFVFSIAFYLPKKACRMVSCCCCCCFLWFLSLPKRMDFTFVINSQFHFSHCISPYIYFLLTRQCVGSAVRKYCDWRNIKAWNISQTMTPQNGNKTLTSSYIDERKKTHKTRTLCTTEIAYI